MERKVRVRNESGFRAVLRLSPDAGVHGLWVAGGTGEGAPLPEQENGRLDGRGSDAQALEQIKDAPSLVRRLKQRPSSLRHRVTE
jgi:hypothetical protein